MILWQLHVLSSTLKVRNVALLWTLPTPHTNLSLDRWKLLVGDKHAWHNELKIWAKCHISISTSWNPYNNPNITSNNLMFWYQSAEHAFHLLSLISSSEQSWFMHIVIWRFWMSWDVRVIEGQKWRFSFSLSDHVSPFLTWALKSCFLSHPDFQRTSMRQNWHLDIYFHHIFKKTYIQSLDSFPVELKMWRHIEGTFKPRDRTITNGKEVIGRWDPEQVHPNLAVDTAVGKIVTAKYP